MTPFPGALQDEAGGVDEGGGLFAGPAYVRSGPMTLAPFPGAHVDTSRLYPEVISFT